MPLTLMDMVPIYPWHTQWALEQTKSLWTWPSLWPPAVLRSTLGQALCWAVGRWRLFGYQTSLSLPFTWQSCSTLIQVGFVMYKGLPRWRGAVLKNLPAMQEMQVWSLSWKDPLEEEMVTHSHILAWEIPWTEDLGRLQSTGLRKRWTWLSD